MTGLLAPKPSLLRILPWLGLLNIGSTQAQIIKLPPPPSHLEPSARHGISVALNDRYAVVGQPGASRRADEAGAVHVYSAVHGRRLRTLEPSDLQPEQRFGERLALAGHMLLVSCGSPHPERRAVYVFDLRAGRLLRKLTSPSGNAPNEFGSSLALTASRIFVGARGENNEQGAVHEFDLATGAHLHQFVLNAPEDFDRLGASLAVAGGVLFAGAPGKSGGRGAVILFDWQKKFETKTITRAAPVAGDLFGTSLAVAGDRLLVGAPHAFGGKGGIFSFAWRDGGETHSAAGSSMAVPIGSSLAASRELVVTGPSLSIDTYGKTELFDSATLTLLGTTTGAVWEENYGTAVALFGSRLLIGAPTHDPDEAGNAFGMAYLFNAPQAGVLPLTALMTPGTLADGGGVFRALGHGFINDVGSVIASASLNGATPQSANAGVWADAAVPGSPSLLGRKGVDVSGHPAGPGPRVTRLDWPMMNRPGHGLLRAHFSSGRVGVYRGGTGGALDSLLPVDTGHLIYGGATFRKISDLAQSFFTPFLPGDAFGSYAIRFQLGTLGGGAFDRAKDSGVLVADSGNTVDSVSTFLHAGVVEGSAAPGGGNTYGELGQRVAHTWRQVAFNTNLTGPLGTRQALVRVDVPFNMQHLVADAAVEVTPGPGDAFYRVFTGVGIQRDLLAEWAVWRASMKGPGVTARTNEGLWHEERGMLLGKGLPLGSNWGMLSWNRVLGVWPAGTGGQLIVLATVRGHGINPTNDLGLWLLAGFHEVHALLREGQQLDLPDRPRVRTISRVDVASNGRFVILASLTGTSARNQMLFTGHANADFSMMEQVLMQAVPVLRKGSRVQHAVFGPQPVALQSLALPKTTDPGGMGGRGLSQVINQTGALALKVRAGRREVLMSGTP